MKTICLYKIKEGWKNLAIACTCVIAFSISCTNNNNSAVEKKEKASYTKPPSGLSDSLQIKTDAAVFFNPDSAQLASIKEETEKMVFESNIHDCFYQMRNARMVLKKYWPQIQIIETGRARFLEFEKGDGIKSLIDLDEKKEQCGLILFNRIKDPLLVDMTNIETQLADYFKH